MLKLMGKAITDGVSPATGREFATHIASFDPCRRDKIAANTLLYPLLTHSTPVTPLDRARGL